MTEAELTRLAVRVLGACGVGEADAGDAARILVAGSAIFHSGDPERATRELKAAAEAALPASSPAAR